MSISNQIFEHYRSEQKKIEDAISLLKEKGYRIYNIIESEEEVV